MEEKQKTAGELRREALLYQPKNGYDRLSAQDEADMKSYCEDYKKFLDAGDSRQDGAGVRNRGGAPGGG